MKYLSNLTDDIISYDKSGYKLSIVHNNQKYNISVSSDWISFNPDTKYNLIEYFKLCIDTNTLKGELTVKT